MYNKHNNKNKSRYNSKQQDTKSAKKWEQKEKNSKITLTKESSHFIASTFSDSFFKEFDLVMKLKKEELKKHGKANAQVSEITEKNIVEVFGVTKDHMVRPAKILGKGESTENLGNS